MQCKQKTEKRKLEMLTSSETFCKVAFTNPFKPYNVSIAEN